MVFQAATFMLIELWSRLIVIYPRFCTETLDVEPRETQNVALTMLSILVNENAPVEFGTFVNEMSLILFSSRGCLILSRLELPLSIALCVGDSIFNPS